MLTFLHLHHKYQKPTFASTTIKSGGRAKETAAPRNKPLLSLDVLKSIQNPQNKSSNKVHDHQRNLKN